MYFGVVALRGNRLVTFLSQLNKLELWGTDIGNAYTQNNNQGKGYSIGGPEFGALKGYILVVYKALDGLRSYGLRSSGLVCLQRFAYIS
jgi:hypothetical protein